MDRDQLRNFATNAQAMIDAGSVEDRLRHYLSVQLPLIFPEHPWWVQAHAQGTEEHVHFASPDGDRYGFVDTVVGKTAVEYEKNLTIQGIFNEGYHQVEEYCAALYNIGIPENEILGVLSDTVRWYGYKMHIIGEASDGELYGPANVELEQISYVDLSIGTPEAFTRFEHFVNQFMARTGSRLLNANTLVTDFGIDSSFYSESIESFSSMVANAMLEKPDYATMIKQVWQNFIAYLGASEYGAFSISTYVSEFYLVTIAKVICANILSGRAIISSRDEIKKILNGEYFTQQNIYNFIDYDYFGWLNDSPYVDQIITSVEEMQRRLQAYDFSRIIEQDIFGKLLAQLADSEHRLMLGQEFTPHWIARDIVTYNLTEMGDEEPRFLDMCCGSGVFLIEAIKAVREKYDITTEQYNAEKDAIGFSCVMGFDIDPLAVMLAKVNWIMTMRDLFPVHTGSIIVPIYHADSLFIATPITHHMPTGEDDYYILNLDDHEVTLPAFLLSPAYRKVFDSLTSKAYRLAMIRADVPEDEIGAIEIETLIDAVIEESGAELTAEVITILSDTAEGMINVLEGLQRQGRNGIWHFIISNSYRPGLTTQQFNCIISNPPWMTMSKLANNPYKEALTEIARNYSIQPSGAAHPHMELGTIFLVCSISRYLRNGARWSCLMPASLLSGFNHEAFRKEKYKDSDMYLEAIVSSIWELPNNTFKNKAIVLSGLKGDEERPEVLDGRVYTSASEYEECSYTLNQQGNRSAWTNRGNDAAVIDVINDESINFIQGCDLFPRTALFHQFSRRQNENVNIAPIGRNSELWYLVSESKKPLCYDLVAEDFNKNYIFSALISKHLSPFIMAEPVDVIMPGKKENNSWIPISTTDLAMMNASTAYVFRQISETIGVELVPYLEDVINIRNKLYQQRFGARDWLVLSSASGANPCAAYINLTQLDRNRIVIDQTLYWYLATSEEEAIFLTGLLNSAALAEAISDFQPEGGFGKRHIHALPYKLIPSFNADDETHVEVVQATSALIEEWRGECEGGNYHRLLHPNSSSLNARRRQQQAKIRTLESYNRYNIACAIILGG